MEEKMTMYLRMVAPRIVEGILIPFAGKLDDKYGNFWDAATNFALKKHPLKPVFFHHSLRTWEDEPGGELINSSFELRAGGLYGRAELYRNADGDRGEELVSKNRAAWSTGTFPHYIRLGQNGYIKQWPIVEASLADIDQTAALNGLTRAVHVRSFIEDNEGEDDMFLSRSVWVGGGGIVRGMWNDTQPPVTEPVVVVPPPNQFHVPTGNPVLEALQRMETGINTRLEALEARETPATRALLPNQPMPTIQVTQDHDAYDGVDLLTMLVHDEAMRLHRTKMHGYPHIRSEAFMRAVFAKAMAADAEEEKKFPRAIRQHVEAQPVPLRTFDDYAKDSWRQRVPNLRADEVMQATLVGYGDELVPTLLNSVLWLRWRLESRVLGLLEVFDQPSNPFDWPRFTTGPKIRKVSGPSDLSQFTIPTSPITFQRVATTTTRFTAGKIGTGVIVENDLLEDNKVNFAEALAQQITQEGAAAIDWVLLNADTRTDTNNISHSFDPTGTDYDSALIGFNGLRRLAQAASDSTTTATLSEDTPATLSKLMGTRGIIGRDIGNLVQIIDPGSAYVYDALDEYESLNDVGSQATLLTGQVGAIKGVPLVVSEEMELADSSGKYPANHTSGTLGHQVQINRKGIKVGRIREARLDSTPVPWADGFLWHWTTRISMNQMENGFVAWGYNTTV
jgi:hypothetical protein